MCKTMLVVTLMGVSSLAGDLRALAQTVPPKEDEARLIGVLKSDAPRKDKVDACRQLALIGTAQAVAPLAAMLDNEDLSHMARYALEAIPDPAVDEALVAAMARLKGRCRVGVIASVGVRRYGKAVGTLAGLLKDGDAEVSQAAAGALGRIGDAGAAKAIQAALPGVPSASLPAFREAMLRCAEALAGQGQRDHALALYESLLKSDTPHQVRSGALRGVLLNSGEESPNVLRRYLRDRDPILFSAAVQATYEMPGPAVTQILAGELDTSPGENKILVIQALALRRQAEALPPLFAAAKTGSKPIRVAAIQALPQIGHASAVPVLAGLLADADPEVSRTAQEALAAMPGSEADAAVMGLFKASDLSSRLAGLELMGRRRMTAAVPELLKAAGDTNARVRTAAIKKVGELGSAADLGSALDLLGRLSEAQDLSAAEQAIVSLCMKAEDSGSCAEELAGLLPQAPASRKPILLRALVAVGGSRSLEAVRAAVKDPNPEVRGAAVRALCTWKTADVSPDLLALARTATDSVEKTLCLRALLNLAGRPDLAVDTRLSLCMQVSQLIQQPQERKQLLGVLGGIDSPDALSLIASSLSDAALQTEAAMAVTSLADRWLKSPNAAALAPHLIGPLEKVTQMAGNDDLVLRAKELLRKAKHL